METGTPANNRGGSKLGINQRQWWSQHQHRKMSADITGELRAALGKNTLVGSPTADHAHIELPTVEAPSAAPALD